MSIVLVGSTSGSVTLQEPAVAGTTVLDLPATSGNVVVDSATQTLTNKTLTSPTFGGTPTGVGILTSGTAVASTSETSIDFTGIPSWVKRITVMFNNVSLNGNAEKLLQLGTSSGVTTSGYESNSVIVYGTNSVIIASSASGFVIRSDQPGEKLNGHYVFTLISDNNWVGSSIVENYSDRVWHGAGKINLSGTLDRVRITSTNGTDTFDAGTINILYE